MRERVQQWFIGQACNTRAGTRREPALQGAQGQRRHRRRRLASGRLADMVDRGARHPTTAQGLGARRCGRLVACSLTRLHLANQAGEATTARFGRFITTCRPQGSDGRTLVGIRRHAGQQRSGAVSSRRCYGAATHGTGIGAESQPFRQSLGNLEHPRFRSPESLSRAIARYG